MIAQHSFAIVAGLIAGVLWAHMSRGGRGFGPSLGPGLR